MSTLLDNIYNENYGSSVATNGSFLAVGNPPSKKYDNCEGFTRFGQVFLIKKENYNSNYSIIRTFVKKNNTGTLLTYYTEQSSSLAFTASFVKESELYTDTNTSCSYLIVEDGNIRMYESTYGSALDMCDYFLAIGDSGVSGSFFTGQSSSFAVVDIYKINPNYTVDNALGIVPATIVENLNDYSIPEEPLCSMTGSISYGFGKSVSITNNYLAVGAPYYNSNRGAVYIYKYTDATCIYELQNILTASIVDYPNQTGFGYSICLDKKYENKIIVGSNQLSQSNAYLYLSSSGGWNLTQTFSQNTGSEYYKLDDTTFNLFPSGSQINSRYGYSVSMYNEVIAVGAPTDLVYWEYSGSSNLRQRGSVYLYNTHLCEKCGDYNLWTKLYGDSGTFKNNLFGFDVSLYNNKLLIGSPKPNFPFSSLFISASLDYYDKCFPQNDFGESTYCGQSLLYRISGSNITQSTSIPISKRKEIGKSFNSFGYSVAVSDENIIIGAPIPLNDDFRLSGLFLTESGSASDIDYKNTSSYQSEDCGAISKFVYFQMEDCVTCDYTCNPTGACDNLIIFVDEQGYNYSIANKIYGRSFIYDMTDLQKNYNVGNVFYNNNKLIINNSGSILKDITLDPTDLINPYVNINYKSQVTIFEKQYICTIEPGEFNVSTNPTAVTSSLFDYAVVNKNSFDFENFDIILRYVNSRITNNGSEKWWNNIIIDDLDQSVFGFYTSSYQNYTDNRLTTELRNKCQSIDFDVNGDGITNLQDATALWKYFIYDLTSNNCRNYSNLKSRRTNYNDVLSFLDEKTGKYIENVIKPEFFDYNYNTSVDVTGSYLAPYITTVGLYSGAELVAIAKLAHPIKNTGEIPINIVVKWDV